MLRSLNIGVICGGVSSERRISRRSGRAVYRAVRRLGYPVRLCDPAHAARFRQALKEIDIAFVALHGEGGEDGKIQRRFERAGLTYTGSGVQGCRKSFDKVISKKLFEKHRVPTPPYRVLNPGSGRQTPDGLQGPFFVKPLREGSSIGVFEVEDFSKSAEKINRALRKYKQLLVEKKIEGREFTVGILGCEALPVIELVPKRTFYDYRAKYTKGMTSYRVPAPISKRLAGKLQEVARRAHRILGLRDLSRVDMMVDRKGRPYVLEVNAIPGFTELSLLPKAARERGIGFEGLCENLILKAYQRYQIKSARRPHGKT